MTAEGAAQILASAPARVRETSEPLVARGGTSAQVAKARAAEAAFESAAALQSIFVGIFGDPLDVVSGGVAIMPQEERRQIALIPGEASVQGSLLPSVRPDERRRAIAADLLNEL